MEIESSKSKKLTELGKVFLMALGIALFIRYFLFIPVKVEGRSMFPTLEPNSYIVYEPYTKLERFDIILFHDEQGEAFVKRVIALPGESLSYLNDQLYINGELIEESFLVKGKNNNQVNTPDFTLDSMTGVEVVPEGSYYVLGDNRPRSKDSRMFGFVSEMAVEGKARFVIFPFNEISILP